MNFGEAAAIYAISQHCVSYREVVRCEPVRKFARDVRRFCSTAADFADDDSCAAMVRRIRRSVRDVASNPLPLSDEALGLRDATEFVTEWITRSHESYPADLIARAQLVSGDLAHLAAMDANPIGDVAVEVSSLGDPERCAVLLNDSRRLDAAARWFKTKGVSLRVVTHRELEDVVSLESLVVIGPAAWFPLHILTAPRAEIVTLVHYSWVRDAPPLPGLFAESSVSRCGLPIRDAAPNAEVQSEEEAIDAMDLLPPVDWSALAVAAGPSREREEDPDVVAAYILLLTRGLSAYVEAGDGPTIYVVDPDAEGSERFRKEPTKGLKEGDCIVLRSSRTAGDYIQEIADGVLGNAAPALRRMQREWKAALREVVLERGFSRVRRELSALGIQSPNLRYRLSSQSIKTKQPEEFRVLMEHIGLGARADELWQAMDKISDAHSRAGQVVRRELEAQVHTSDVSQLKREGWLEVELAEASAGVLSILRIERKSPDPVFVNETQLRVLQSVDPDLWQG